MFKFFLLIVLRLALLAQISEEDFKKSFKRPDEVLLKQIKQSLIIPTLTEDFVKVYADNLKYDINSEVIRAFGGATILYKDTVVQAESLVYNKSTGEIIVDDGVRIFRGSKVIEAESLRYDILTGKGEFKDGKAFFLDSLFSFESEKGQIENSSRIRLENAEFSSCRCSDGKMPWSFDSTECQIIKQDSITAKNVKFRVFGTPIFYLPYVKVPLLESRKAGFLSPKLGISRRHGFFAETPIFLPPSDTSDLIITPFTYTKTRFGIKGRGTYLMPNSGYLSAAFFYSNESPRFKNGDYELRGLKKELFRNAKIDKNRLAGSVSFYSVLSRDPKSYILDAIVDAKRASDDLLIKETKNDIARHSIPFLVSSANLRLRTSSFGSFVIGANSVQDFGRFQDRIFDEVPSFNHLISKQLGSMRLGSLGFTPVIGHNLNFTNYIRQEGFEGRRLSFKPNLNLNMSLSNLINLKSQAISTVKFYSVDQENDFFEDRLITNRLENTFSTKLERVILSSSDSRLLDASTQKYIHYLEPFFGNVFQRNSKNLDKIPNFNPVIDRQRDIEALKYGFKTYVTKISHSGIYIDKDFPEILPNLYDYLGQIESLKELSLEDSFRSSDYRKSSVLSVEVSELYSLDEEFEVTGSKFSNTSLKARFNPLENLSFRVRTAYDRSNRDLTFARFGSKSVLGDVTTYLDYIFKEKNQRLQTNTSEIIGGIKFELFDRVSVGSWVRYDLEASKVLDSYSVLQLAGKCKCWFLDFGLEKNQNPDDLKLSVSIVLSGIGDIVQEIPFQWNRKQE